VYFLISAGPCAPAYSKKISDFLPANTTTSFTITLNSIYAIGGTDYIGDKFAIVALYDPLNGGVSLGFDSARAASILAESPAPDFTGPWTIGYGGNGAYNPNGVEESVVADALQSGTYNGVSLDDSNSGGLQIDPNTPIYNTMTGAVTTGEYFPTISTNALAPAAFTLVNFSGASAGGSGNLIEVVASTKPDANDCDHGHQPDDQSRKPGKQPGNQGHQPEKDKHHGVK
jgi:hypothetical protein